MEQAGLRPAALAHISQCREHVRSAGCRRRSGDTYGRRGRADHIDRRRGRPGRGRPALEGGDRRRRSGRAYRHPLRAAGFLACTAAASSCSRPARPPRRASFSASTPDMAVILLDVVMETEGAGLELVQFVRTELKNETVRIILRTGQPGQAPERRVVVDYDINDYKAKTELTADKLFTTLTAALRSYEQLHEAGADAARPRDHHRRGGDALRPALAAASRRRRADAALLADGGRMRRHSCACARRAIAAFRCSPAPAAIATT